MAQWTQMNQLFRYLQTQTVTDLYPPATFPIEVRYFLADWIEEQRWEDFDLEKVEQESQAQALLEQIISILQSLAQQKPNVVEKMRLMHISRNMNMFRQQPLQFGVMVRDILRKERVLLSKAPSKTPNLAQFPQSPNREPASSAPNMRDVDHLVLKVLELQDCRQKIHQLQEELNWERQNFEALQGPIQQNGLDPQNAELQKVQNNIQQLEYNVKAMVKNRLQLLQGAVDCLDQCQSRLINRLKEWRWEQHQATIGHPFEDNLSSLQTWCEQLVGVNGKLRQEVMLVGEPIPELQERLGQLLRALIQSSLMVEKQPPQVIKTQSKFSTTVRYLLGEKVAPGKPVVLKAQIITEAQARSLGQLGNMPSENVGELINNTAILEHNTASKSTCATFRNMSIKKIKRADRKGSESVTEEKFALLFSAEITITGCDTSHRIQMISLPVVIIVHGSQDNNALATVIWDCAFSEPNRIPFVVPERVPWKLMCMTLNTKFMSEVQTHHCLDQYNQHFLAQKIFDKPDISGDFSNMMVSWAQFNKEVLPGRQFTFWQWFEGVMELTKKHLRTYWSDGLIFGFIGKQHLHLILKDRPNGTFLLRFSDSEIGGITIAYVAATENGGQKIQNIQPFTKRDLEIRCLGNRIGDIGDISFLYPDYPKHDVFKKYYTDDPLPSADGGYIGVTLQTKVTETGLASPNVSNMTPRSETPQDHNALVYPIRQFQQPFPTEPLAGPSADFSNPSTLFPENMDPHEGMDMEIEELLKTFEN
ncbi:signal transducer and activator of transcription 6 [Polymixia lowei]